MERENFLYKITGSFGFNTGDKDISIVTQKLGIKPIWGWSKDDEWFQKSTNEIRYRPHGIWGYEAKSIFVDIVPDISPIIQNFRELLFDKIEIINELINEYQFECNIRITIYTEEEGACGATINKNDLLFLSNFSNFDISYLQVENVEE
jgi:hypothetical protein